MTDHHHYQLLHKNELGYIMKCSDCQKIQALIGNLYTWMPMNEYRKFTKAIHGIASHDTDLWCTIDGIEKIHIRTPVQNIMLSFSKKEFELLQELINVSMLLLESQLLLAEE